MQEMVTTSVSMTSEHIWKPTIIFYLTDEGSPLLRAVGAGISGLVLSTVTFEAKDLQASLTWYSSTNKSEFLNPLRQFLSSSGG
jgi:hypothetical protein